MKDIHLIDSLDALRAMSDPLRMQILQSLQSEARTAAQVARLLGHPANKLHYHVAELERHSLIEAVETRRKGNLLETYYRPVARIFRVESSLFETGVASDALAAFYQSGVSLLDTAAAHLRDDIDTGRVTEREAGASQSTLLRARLRHEDAAEFKVRLNDLLKEFGQRSGPDIDEWIALTVLFYPLTAAAAADDDTPAPTDTPEGDVS